MTDESVKNLMSRIGGLDIADGNYLPTLAAAVRGVTQENASLKQRIHRLERLVSELIEGSNGNINTGDETEKTAEELEKGSNDAQIQSIVTQITSRTDQNCRIIEQLLNVFDTAIKRIVEVFLPQIYEEDTMWKIVQECCIQAVPYGLLDSGYYAVSTSGLSQEECTGDMEQLLEDSRKRVRQQWERFWALSLNKFQLGPTLFIPPKPFLPYETQKPPHDPPKYLFRAYDSRSHGINSPNIIASIRHFTMQPPIPKFNILYGDLTTSPTDEAKQLASKMLHSHLLGSYIDDESDKAWILQNDNLVSWSSSLMYVIQYANFKFCKTGEDVMICAVDTTKFPKGQFMRDLWLLEHYRNGKFNEKERWLRGLRSGRPDLNEYNNGEWLSQGILDVEGRSCTLSLRTLKQAGLWDLYPEFNINSAKPDDPVRSKWPDYVTCLRNKWATRCTTTKDEVETARDIAIRCFRPLDDIDIALLLLGFRNREFQVYGGNKRSVEEPVEIGRYKTSRIRYKMLGPAASLDELFALTHSDDNSVKDGRTLL